MSRLQINPLFTAKPDSAPFKLETELSITSLNVAGSRYPNMGGYANFSLHLPNRVSMDFAEFVKAPETFDAELNKLFKIVNNKIPPIRFKLTLEIITSEEVK